MANGKTLYTEIARGTYANRGYIYAISEIGELKKTLKSKEPAFYSYYAFEESIINVVKETKSVSNYKGIYHLNQIIFDIDLKDRSDEQVLAVFRGFLEGLHADGVDWDVMIPFYSGSGYHVHIPNVFDFKPSENLPQLVRKTLTKHWPEADNIYEGSRIIRIPGTFNLKTNRYKIPLTAEEVYNLSAEEIIKKAETEPREYPLFAEGMQRSLSHMIVLEDDKVRGKPVQDIGSTTAMCAQKLFLEPPAEGIRHDYILRMTSAYRRAGVPKSGVMIMMKSWAKGLSEIEIEKFVDDVYRTGYRYGCEDKILSAHCDSRCAFYQNKNYNVSICKSNDMEERYKKFVSTDFEGRKFSLSDIWPKFTGHYDFYPGEFILIFGDTGLGKTAFMQNIVIKLPTMRSLFLSLETSQNLLFRRFLQIGHNMTKEQIDSHYQNKGDDLGKILSHISVMTIAPDFKILRRIVGEINPKIIVVDTTDSIPYPGLKDLGKEEAIAVGLKELAQSMDIIIFGVHHISKGATQGPLTVHSGKGSSTFEQKADKVIAIEGQRNLPPRRISSLKARDEKPFAIQMSMDGNTFIYSMR